MPRRFHNVHVVAYPVGRNDENFSVDGHEGTVGKNALSKGAQKHTELTICGGEYGREAQFFVVVRAVLLAVYPHSRQFVLKFNHY